MQSKRDERKKIQIRCFGKLAIYVNGVEQSAQMNSMKARELIAFLLTYKGEAVHKSKVCEALWQNKTKKKSKDSLYKLIKKIEEMPIPFKIRKSRGMIQLCLDNIECDLLLFERLINDQSSIKSKEMAVALYSRGPLFEEEDYDWIYLKDGIYDFAYFETLEQLCSYYEERNRRKASRYSRLMEECE